MAVILKLDEPKKGIFSPVAILPPGKSNLKLYHALWDTGATDSIISNKVLDELGLTPVGESKAGFMDDGVWKVSTMLVYCVDLVVSDVITFRNVMVKATNLLEVDILIGMDVMSQGDFSYYKDLASGSTIFTFRLSNHTPSLS